MAMTQRDRAAFLYEAGREGMPIDVARKLLRYGSTLHRLAEAQCNGDWPADNGTGGTPCVRCESVWRGKMTRIAKAFDHLNTEDLWLCEDCRTSDAVKALIATLPGEGCTDNCGAAREWGLELSSDPRGAVLKVKAPSGRVLVAG